MEYQVIDEAEAREQLRRAALDELSRIELDHLRHTIMLEADEAAGKDIRWRENTLQELEAEHDELLKTTPSDFFLPVVEEPVDEEVPEVIIEEPPAPVGMVSKRPKKT